MKLLKPIPAKYKILACGVICAGVLAGCLYRVPLWETLSRYYFLVTDREKVETFVTSFGLGAPLVFVVIQILQVLFAPIPGEATGFIGGYLFGPSQGFLYSSIALTLGSWINFTIGRFLGKRYVRKLIPSRQLEKFDKTLKRQGIFVLFILFVFPGFPKDYLCLFLGVSALPLKVFIALAAVGRMPGTFMLSLQGAYHYEQRYGLFALLLGLCFLFAFIGYRYREAVYRWIERYNEK